MKPGEKYWSLVEPIWDAISIYDGAATFLKQYEAAPEVARALFAAHWCQSEVLNGGLHQFFENSTGVLAPEALEAYRKLGMPRLAAVLEAAMAWFGSSYLREREDREEKLETLAAEHPDAWDPFDKLDEEFFDLIESEAGGFESAADTYAENHG